MKLETLLHRSAFAAVCLFTVMALALSGCSSSKEGFEPYESTLDEDYPEAQENSSYASQPSESIYDGTPLPDRIEGANPDTADYQTLSPYIVYFAFDSFSIEAAQRHKVENIAKWMQSHPEANLVVAGHCDERGTTEYNLALGERRALAIRDYLVGLGANKNKIMTTSYGEERPAVQGSSESSWSKNRRGETGILQ